MDINNNNPRLLDIRSYLNNKFIFFYNWVICFNTYCIEFPDTPNVTS